MHIREHGVAQCATRRLALGQPMNRRPDQTSNGLGDAKSCGRFRNAARRHHPDEGNYIQQVNVCVFRHQQLQVASFMARVLEIGQAGIEVEGQAAGHVWQ